MHKNDTMRKETAGKPYKPSTELVLCNMIIDLVMSRNKSFHLRRHQRHREQHACTAIFLSVELSNNKLSEEVDSNEQERGMRGEAERV
jgi:hypothetical protein